MAEKLLYSRLQQKHDTETNWLATTDFIPLVGEIIVYDKDENYNYERIKIGDGTHSVNNLPFINIQSDYGQNDTNAANYINNRTHYYKEPIVINTTAYGSNGTFKYNNAGQTIYNVSTTFLTPNELLGATIVCSGQEYKITADLIKTSYNFDAQQPYFVFHPKQKDVMPDYPALVFIPKNFLSGGIGGPQYSFQVKDPKLGGIYVLAGACSSLSYGGELKQLDEIYIPSTIARIIDLPVIDSTLTIEGAAADAKAVGDALVESVADWNETDETNLAFIKNKPIEETEDDALEMLTEMGILDPIQDEENNILTDEDGNIFTIE